MKKLFAAAAATTVLIAGTASAQIVLQSGQVGAPYSAALSSPGYISPTYSVTSAPPGLFLVGPTITGTPTTAGTYDFIVQASGSVSATCMVPNPMPPYIPSSMPCLLPAASAQTYRMEVTAVPAAVPTMSEWAMILLGVLLAGGAALTIQRRRTA